MATIGLGERGDPEDGVAGQRGVVVQRRCADGVDVHVVAAGHEEDQTRDVAGCNLRCQLVVHTVQSLLRQRVGGDLVVGQGFTPGWCRAM